MCGDVASWLMTASKLLELATMLPPFNAIILYVTVAQSASSLGQIELAEVAFAAADAVEGGPEFAGIRSFAEAVRALHRYLLGDIVGARAAIERSLEISGLAIGRMLLWLVIPLVAAATGDARLVTPDDERGIRELQTSGCSQDDAAMLASLAAWKIAQGQMSEARRLLGSVLDGVVRPSPGGTLLLALCAEHGGAGDLEKLREILATKLHAGDIAGRASVSLALAILARRSGDLQAAAASALDAVSDYRRLRWPMFEARALEVAGRADEARDLYERCGAIGDIARLQPAAPVRAENPERMLTRRERAIAGLIALGRTNAQIGEELTINVKTVEKHVSSILAKFGVRNRVQIAKYSPPAGIDTSRR
jgi:DNA-binding CsgD family transcriptional regulator